MSKPQGFEPVPASLAGGNERAESDQISVSPRECRLKPDGAAPGCALAGLQVPFVRGEMHELGEVAQLDVIESK